jgi:hypothetical protein
MREAQQGRDRDYFKLRLRILPDGVLGMLVTIAH